jgi:hypothetical protein
MKKLFLALARRFGASIPTEGRVVNVMLETQTLHSKLVNAGMLPVGAINVGRGCLARVDKCGFKTSAVVIRGITIKVPNKHLV